MVYRTYCTKITRQARQQNEIIIVFIVYYIEWHRGVISDSILAVLKDLRTKEDVPEHSLHSRDAFKILERRR